MQLRPCLACKRHVAVDAASCPFCAASLATAADVIEPPGRLSRAAVFAAGMAAIAATGSACWTNKSEPTHVQQQTTTIAPDAAVTQMPDAAVPPDAAIVKKLPDRHYQNHPCTDTPKGPICAPYGAPPMRRRTV
jgi:hypothetical protein